MHLDVEQIQRFLHGELSGTELERVQNHLEVCPGCRRASEQSRSEEAEIFRRLSLLDHPEPQVSADAIAALAARQPWRWGRWAAGVVLALGATSLAYAAPGSPMKGWLESVLPGGRSAPVIPKVDTVPLTAGIAVNAGTRLSILFEESQEVGELVVVLTDENRVSVSAQDGTAAFDSDTHRLSVLNQGSRADFRIHIPFDAPLVEIRVSGSIVFRTVGGRVESEFQPDEQERYHIPIRSAGPR